MSKELKGRGIAVLATDGFEKVELTIPVAALRSAGAQVDVVSLHHGSIRGVNLHKPANMVHVTKTVLEANPANYDALLVPGGFINPDMLRQSAEARDFVRAFNSANKPIATLQKYSYVPRGLSSENLRMSDADAAEGCHYIQRRRRFPRNV